MAEAEATPDQVDDILYEFITFLNSQAGAYADAMAGFAGGEVVALDPEFAGEGGLAGSHFGFGECRNDATSAAAIGKEAANDSPGADRRT